MIMSKRVTFEDALSDTDWGLIIDNKGRLKGLFVPDGCDEDDVPDSIIKLCCDKFGIDPQEFCQEEIPALLH
jgi:hypothetical protein